MKAFSIFFLIVTAAQATAQEQAMDGAELKQMLNDITLTSKENGRVIEQVFQSGGATFTVDVKTKALSQGFWRLEGDKYCSQWPPSEHWSCYDVFENDLGVVFVSSHGTRYQMNRPPAD